MIQFFIDLVIDLLIFVSYIFVINFIIYKFHIKKKIVAWGFFFVILPAIFITIEYIIRVEPLKIIDKKFDDFHGFVYEIEKFSDDTALILIKFMKKYPKKIRQTDFIIGYKTTYITTNNKSNLHNAKIIRVFYTNDKSACLSKNNFSKYFLNNKNRYNFDYANYNQTNDGKCLALRHILANEVNKYQFKPPILNYTQNHIKHIFPPFFHSNTTIFTAIAPTNRAIYAIENKASNKNNYMIYSVTVLNLGTIQNFFGTVLKASDTQILEKFFKEIYR